MLRLESYLPAEPSHKGAVWVVPRIVLVPSSPLVCKEYELAETAVGRWVRQAEVDAGLKPGVTSSESEENARLRKQLREVTKERDILARAVGFFAKGTDDRRLPGVHGGGEAGRS
jgi:transposase-like protein